MVIGRIFGDWFRDKLGVYLIIMILFLFTNISLIILIYFNSVLSSIIGFSLLGLGTSLVVPIAYSLAGKIKGIDSGVAISIISISVYGTFMAAPASLGFIANSYGINNIFFPMLILFAILILAIPPLKNKLKL